MINILGTIPNRISIAVSGGPDSMAALDFLVRSKRHISALYFNHGTEHGKDAERLVSEYCTHKNIPLDIGNISRDKYKEESQEEYWRNERYSFFSYHSGPIITCHHLDDAVETWIFTSLNGNSYLIPYKRDNFIRPFLITRKEELVSWCERKNVPHILDPSNSELRYRRNFIRHKLVPLALEVNPGLHKVVKRKIVDQYATRWAWESVL